MPKTLKHSLSSDYLAAARLLSPKKKRKRVVVYVESYDDIAFWRDILKDFENDKRYFEVMLPANSRNLVHGKKSVLMQSLQNEQLGENLIACVDSDYDFLLQGASDSSKQCVANLLLRYRELLVFCRLAARSMCGGNIERSSDI